MVTDSFDNISEPVISPQHFFGEKKNLSEVAIVTFSREINEIILEQYPKEQIGEIRAANRIRPIYLITVDGMKLVYYLSEIGSALASTDVIEVNWLTGAEKFILFGSAGSLDQKLTQGKYVLPTQAYRDEGTSYHFVPPADYIKVRQADFLAALFEREKLPYVRGKVWTTDAIYRETKELVRKRKEEGCIAVEMEVAGVQAVCDHYGWELYDFLVTGDVLDQPEYTADGLFEANHSLDKFFVALMIAKELRAGSERS